jgi:cation diffusion facilitator family transporter
VSLIPDYGDPSDLQVRARYGKLVSGVCLAGNLGLFLAKLLLGITVLSMAIIGDSLNHVADLAVSLVMLYSFYVMAKPPDAEHPYGHGRAESILAVAVSSLIISMGILVIYEAAGMIDNPRIDADILTVVLMVLFSLAKFAMAAFAFAITKKVKSQAIRADAWNHLSDGLISVFVAAGVFVTILSADFRFLDPVFAIGIGIFVIITGIRLVRSSAEQLMGGAPDEEVIGEIGRICASVPSVINCHNIQVHEYGIVKYVSFHVDVPEDMSAKDAHAIADEIERRVQRKLRTRPVVHVDPRRTGSDERAVEDIKRLAAGFPEVISVHRAETTHTKDGPVVRMHVVTDRNMSIEDGHKLTHRIMEEVRRRHPEHKAEIHLEPCPEDCESCRQECEAAIRKAKR